MEAKDIKQGFDLAKSYRVVIEDTWEEAVYYTVPRKRDIKYDKENGEKVPFDVYDDTAIQGNQVLAAGLSGYMTNAAQRWFEMRPRNEALMNNDRVKRFFVDSTDIMYSVFGASNFYQQIHEAYLDLGSFGNATIYEEEDEREDVRFYARNPKEIYFIENDKEVVDMVYRHFKMTAWQAYNFFGSDKCGEQVKKCVDEKKDYNKEFWFIHYVCPRHKRDVSKKDAQNKPFASYWYSEADSKIIKEGGYEEFPFFVPRFYKNSGETYGYSPAMGTLSNIKMINRMMEAVINGAEVSVWPPYLLEHDSMVSTLDLRAGALNYQKQPLSQGPAVQQLGNEKMHYQLAIDFITRVESKIKSAFFVDVFLLLTQLKNMTATEVIERTQEKMLILGPILGRMQSELLNPMIIRTFGILQRRGKLPPVPEELIGQEFDIVYVSPLAKAQRSVQSKDMTTYLSIIGQMAQMLPEVLHKIDGDAIVDKMAKFFSVDPDIIRNQEEVDAIRQGIAQQAQQQERMMNMANVAQIAETAGKANKNFASSEQQAGV